MVEARPVGLAWRASSTFILSVVAVSQFSDLFIYGMVIPILPYVLSDRLQMSPDKIQSNVSTLLAAYSFSGLVFAIPAGWLADWTTTRRLPYLAGLAALIASTILFACSYNLLLLLLSRILQGMSAAVVHATGLAMVIDTVGSKHLGSTLGLIQSFVAIGELAAPPLGGFLYARIGYRGLLGASVAVIAGDFLMRLLVVEKVAEIHPCFRESLPYSQGSEESGSEADMKQNCMGPQAIIEEEPLLIPKQIDSDTTSKSWLMRHYPIFLLCTEKRLLVALLLGFVQALIIGTYDATLTTEVKDEFGFSSLEAGRMFLLLGLPGLILAPVAGGAVDRCGARLIAIVGFSFYAVCLALLRLPGEKLLNHEHNIILFCAVLALNGICSSLISTPSVVEAQAVVEGSVKRMPLSFGPKGPYGQLFGLTGFLFNAGLTVGPIVSGPLRTSIGYGNMYAFVASLSAITAVLSFAYLGDTTKTENEMT